MTISVGGWWEALVPTTSHSPFLHNPLPSQPPSFTTEETPMSTRTDPWPAGTPCWVDLSVPDVQAAVDFYAAVIGWTFVDSGPDYGNYHIAQVDGRAAAGVGPIMQEGQPSA